MVPTDFLTTALPRLTGQVVEYQVGRTAFSLEMSSPDPYPDGWR